MKVPYLKSIVLLVLIITSGILFAQSPGAVDDFSIWLNGNFNQSQVTQEYLNNNKSLKFNGDKKIEMPHSLKELQIATILTVYKEQSSNIELPIWEIAGPFSGLSLSTQNLSKSKGKYKIPYTVKSESQNEYIPQTKINRYTRSLLKSEIESGYEKPPVLSFGQSSFPEFTTGFAGVIAEFILYERILKTEDLNRLESYLAIKYGVSLQKDYLNSADQKVWNFGKHKEYSNHIAGIARDDRAGLYQIKSSADNNAENLSIGIIHSVNTKNDDDKLINDMAYLLWGDNGMSLNFVDDEMNTSNEFKIVEKKWLINASSNNAKPFPTSIQVDLNEMLKENVSPEEIYLLIDRSGKGEFYNEKVEVIRQSHLPIGGRLRFNNINWDTDGSGNDVFTFGHRKNAIGYEHASGLQGISVNAFPNPSLDGNFKLSVSLTDPTNIEVQIYDANQRLVEVMYGNGKANYQIPGFVEGGPGVYTFLIITPKENLTHKFIIE